MRNTWIAASRLKSPDMDIKKKYLDGQVSLYVTILGLKEHFFLPSSVVVITVVHSFPPLVTMSFQWLVIVSARATSP